MDSCDASITVFVTNLHETNYFSNVLGYVWIKNALAYYVFSANRPPTGLLILFATATLVA